MLRHVGRSTPLVVVFVGLCCGIFIRYLDKNGILFSIVFLFLLLSRRSLLPALAGIIIGLSAASIAPSWIDISESQHRLKGTIQSITRSNGIPRLLIRTVVLDGKRIQGLVQLNVYKGLPEISEGSTLTTTFTGKLNSGFGNSGELDYRLNLLAKGIVLTGKINESDILHVKDFKKINGLKSEVNAALDRLASPEAETLKAMLTGDTSGIAYSIQDRFSSLGISHLIAISGLNMAIIFFLGYHLVFCILRVFVPFSIRWDTPFISKIFGIACLFCYSAFIGPLIPSMRAAIMAVLCAVGYFVQRKSNVLENLAAAGIIVLSIWPHSIYSASFLLTFAAVLAIIGILYLDLKINTIFQIILIPIVITAFTIPITNYLFGLISWTGIIVNIIFVPLFSMVIMPLSITGLVLFSFSHEISVYLFSLAIESIKLIFLLSDTIGFSRVTAQPSIYWVYASYLGLIIAFFGERSKMRFIICTFLIIFLLANPIIRYQERIKSPLAFDFMSVGQGDGILITEKSHAILIDAGPNHLGFDCGRHIIAPHLLKKGITSLDLLIITHTHPDHIGGAPYILQYFPVRRVWVNDMQCRNPYFMEVLRITKEKSIPIKKATMGDEARFNRLNINILNPPKHIQEKGSKLDQNMQSIVVYAGDTNMKGLFMGDAESFGELIVLHTNKSISADILKVAHHGSSKSCLDQFLEQVRPEIAVITCGHKNRYGDPTREALSRLSHRNITIYRTDIHGEVTITSYAGGYNVKLGRRHTDNQ